jgi:O-antigen/teichoic acid export membrane protein
LLRGLRGDQSGIQKWLGKGFWAVSDQGLFATSNFLLNVLLARWLNPGDYGAFTMAYSIFLLLGTVHSALLTEPMMVFAPGRYRSRFTPYLETVLNGHWRLSLILAAILVLTSLAVLAAGSGPVGAVVFAMALVTPFILLQWLMRRTCYARLDPRTAAIAGAGYAAWLITGAFALYKWQELSAFSALILMGLGSLAAAAWLSRRVGVRLISAGDRSLKSEVRKDHWIYGRWAVGTGALGWVPGNVFYILLPIWGGLEATGALRAVFNFLAPVIQASAALGLVLLPALVGVRGTPVFRTRLLTAGALLVATAVGYWFLLGLFHEPLLHWLYGGKYDQFASVLLVLGALGVSSAFLSVAGAALRSLERPDHVFWSYALSSTVAVFLGLVLIPRYGVLGAALALTVSSFFAAGALGWFLWKEHPVAAGDRPST